MKHFHIIADLDREYIQEAQAFIKAYLEAKGAKCLLHHTSERTRGAARVNGTQVPGDTECIVTIGGDNTLIQATRDLAGRNTSVLGVSRGHLGYLNQVSHQGDIAPVLRSLLNERYQLERRAMIHGAVWRREEALSKDIALNEVVITRKDPLKMFHYDVYVNDEYLNEYVADGVLVATPTGSIAHNLSVGGPVMAPRARMMVLTPICSHSLNARSVMLAPEDRVRIRVPNSGRAVSFDGNTSMELKAGDYIDTRCFELQIVMIKVKQISFMQNLNNHLGGIQTSGSAEHYKSARKEVSHMKVERHSKIVELIGKYEIETQKELAGRLNEAGFSVTQVTVPRGTHELKLAKIQSESGRQYCVVLKSLRGTSAIKCICTLKDGYMSMDMVQNILVIKTVSGVTMAIAVALDVIQFHEVVGCVAGDDTTMCTIRSMDDTIIVVEGIKKVVEG